MYDLLFQRYEEWVERPPDEMPTILAGYAEELGLDVDQFSQDLENHTYRDKVTAQYEDAVSMRLQSTPTLIVNGRLFPSQMWGSTLAELYRNLDLWIRLAALEPSLYDSPPPQVTDPDGQYFATIRTGKGDIVLELYSDEAPVNVNSLVFLAQEGWYDGVSFHRVIPGFVAQTGDPSGTGAGGPGYECDDEIASLGFGEAGVVGIATSGPNRGSGQFFITLAPQPDLDGRYTVVGRVTEGMDVVENLTPHDPADPAAPPGDLIETILIEER